MSTINLTEESFEQTVKAKGVVLVDWWASWCGPCRAFAPVYEQVSKAFPDVVFAKVDTESEPGLATAFEVRAIPTLSIFRDGVLLFHNPGMVPAKALSELVEQTGKLDMDEVRREIAEERAKDAETPA